MSHEPETTVLRWHPRRVMHMTAEGRRLEEARERTKHWRRWGPYVSDRAYRWNEDGLAGICDRHQRICFALALWNGHDAILKERLFGLTGSEGNHGEDVKEYYFFLDNTPTHAYMKMLYRYP